MFDRTIRVCGAAELLRIILRAGGLRLGRFALVVARLRFRARGRPATGQLLDGTAYVVAEVLEALPDCGSGVLLRRLGGLGGLRGFRLLGDGAGGFGRDRL